MDAGSSFDSGLDRLILMLEERYGRWASHLALLSLLSGLTVGAADLAWAGAVKPLWRYAMMIIAYIHGGTIKLTTQDYFSIGWSFTWAAVAALGFVIVGRTVIGRWDRRAMARIEQMNTIRTELAELQINATAFMKQLEDRRLECVQMLDESRANLSKAENRDEATESVLAAAESILAEAKELLQSTKHEGLNP